MKHVKKLLLIPEELFLQQNALGGDGSALGLVQDQMQKIATAPGLDENAREARYQQEFKRYNKIVREQEEKPVNVRLRNVDELSAAIPKVVASSAKPTRRFRAKQRPRKHAFKGG